MLRLSRLAFLSLAVAWVWERPATLGSLLPRAAHSTNLWQPARGYPQIWQCGGIDDTAVALPDCYVVEPYRSWAITDHSPMLSPRYAHSAVVLDSTLLFLWGGLAAAGVLAPEANPTVLDMAALAPVLEGSLKWVFLEPVLQRWGHSAVAFSAAALPNRPSAVLVFGGAGEFTAGVSNDIGQDGALALCTLTVSASAPQYTLTWSKVTATNAVGDAPAPRHYHAAALYPGTPGATPSTMLVTGGFSFALGRALSDLWQLDLANCAWSEAEGSHCTWAARTPLGLPPTLGHALLVTLRGTLLVYGGNSSGAASPALLAASAFSPSAAPGSSVAFSSPAAGGIPPAAVFLSGAVLFDADGDSEEEMVVLGGQALAPSAAQPRVVAQALVVLSEIDAVYAAFSKELPYLLTGICIACLFLGLLGYLAWRVSVQIKAREGQRGRLGDPASLLLGARDEEEEASALLALESEAFVPNYGGLGASSAVGGGYGGLGSAGDRALGSLRAASLGGGGGSEAGAREAELGGAGAGASSSKGRGGRSRANSRAAAQDFKQAVLGSGEGAAEVSGLTF